MANFTVGKVNGDSLAAAEWNQVAGLNNFINDSGQTASTGNLNQTSIASSIYAAGGDYYTDGGSANAYVLSVVGSKKAPNSYFNGMRVRFRAGNTNTGASTVNVASIGSANIKKQDGSTDVAAGDISTTDDTVLTYDGTNFRLSQTAKVSGDIVQTVNTQTGAVATGATTMPLDDTIPQITEGNEVMTLAITPTNASNKLKIDVVCNLSCATDVQVLQAALFQDATANALASGGQGIYAAEVLGQVTFTYYMTAGTTSATTFRVRCGTANYSITFNGVGGARIHGGVLASSITITEFKV